MSFYRFYNCAGSFLPFFNPGDPKLNLHFLFFLKVDRNSHVYHGNKHFIFFSFVNKKFKLHLQITLVVLDLAVLNIVYLICQIVFKKHIDPNYVNNYILFWTFSNIFLGFGLYCL